MHECNAHNGFLSNSCLKSWDVTERRWSTSCSIMAIMITPNSDNPPCVPATGGIQGSKHTHTQHPHTYTRNMKRGDKSVGLYLAVEDDALIMDKPLLAGRPPLL
jgi:hypothetical protein